MRGLAEMSTPAEVARLAFEKFCREREYCSIHLIERHAAARHFFCLIDVTECRQACPQ